MLTTQNYHCAIEDLGTIDYNAAYAIQKQAVEEVISTGKQRIIFCEHPAVITMGRASHDENLFLSRQQIKDRQIAVLYIDRGGDITLHAPGQLVVYPILNLNYYGKDLKAYLHTLEQVVIDLLSDFGILATRFEGRTGVWTDQKKICSLGIGVRKWVAYHGLGLNVNTDLNLFSMIRPCGLDVAMTSLKSLKKHSIDMRDVKQKCVNHFQKHFSLII